MIEYRGRQKDCFFIRAQPSCTAGATHRVDGGHIILHVCDAHVEKAEEMAHVKAQPLAVDGELDRIAAVPMDPELLLREAPEVVRVVDDHGHQWIRG